MMTQGARSWKQTKIIKNELNPVWDEQVRLRTCSVVVVVVVIIVAVVVAVAVAVAAAHLLISCLRCFLQDYCIFAFNIHVY